MAISPVDLPNTITIVHTSGDKSTLMFDSIEGDVATYGHPTYSPFQVIISLNEGVYDHSEAPEVSVVENPKAHMLLDWAADVLNSNRIKGGWETGCYISNMIRANGSLWVERKIVCSGDVLRGGV